MARRSSSGNKKAGRAAKPARAKKAEVNVVEAEGVEAVGGGMGLEGGIAVTTFVCLLAACVMVIMALSRYP